MEPENQSDRGGFLRRHWPVIAVLGVVAAGAGAASQLISRDRQPPRRAPEPQVVRITPPPTPPPPPKPPEPKPEEAKPEPDTMENKMVEQEPTAAETPKSEDPSPADAAMGTSIRGAGDDGFGLAYSKTGGGNTIGGTGIGSGSGDGGGSRWGWYAAKIRTRITDAIANNRTTRDAAFTVKVRIWSDTTGRVTRATVSPSTGDADVDRALRDEVLTGLTLGDSPPEGMPMPIVIRIAGRRP